MVVCARVLLVQGGRWGVKGRLRPTGYCMGSCGRGELGDVVRWRGWGACRRAAGFVDMGESAAPSLQHVEMAQMSVDHLHPTTRHRCTPSRSRPHVSGALSFVLGTLRQV